MLFYFACEAAGASAPGIPHALLEWKAERFIHTSDAFAPRECRHSRPPLRHRPRRRAIQYCRGADDQSRGRGVLDTRFRGYDGAAYDERDLFAHASAVKRSSFELRASPYHGLLRCARDDVETVMGPPVRAEDLGTDGLQTHIGAAQTRTQTSRQAMPMR